MGVGSKCIAYTGLVGIAILISGLFISKHTSSPVHKPEDTASIQNESHAARFAKNIGRNNQARELGRDKMMVTTNELARAIGDETIAETLSRIQLKFFKPESHNNARPMSDSIAETTNNNPFPYRYPEIRYVQWNELSYATKEILETSLGYSKGSWNYMSNEIETKTFNELTTKQQRAANMLGIDGNVWDCFINRESCVYCYLNILQCITHKLYILHNILYAMLDYSSYNKRDLQSKGLDQYVSVLSEVVYKRWDELNDDAKQAATQLCFFQQTWDEETLGTW